MNNIDKLTQKIFSKFNDNSLFFSNIYLTGTEENKAVVLFDMEGFVLKVCLTAWDMLSPGTPGECTMCEKDGRTVYDIPSVFAELGMYMAKRCEG